MNRSDSDLVMYDLRVSDSDSTDENGPQNVKSYPFQSRKLVELDGILQDIGGFGKFQMFATIVICFGMSATGFFINILSYLTQTPEIECSGISKDACTVEKICQNGSQISNWQIADQSLNNWLTRLDLICAPSWKVGLLGSSFFIGWCLTMLWLPRLSDVKGRWFMFTYAMLIDTVLYTFLLWTQNFNLMVGVLFIFGILSSIRLNVGFVYLLELIPRNKHTLIVTCWCIGEALIYLLATVYFHYVSKDWIYLGIIGYLM